MSTPPDNPQDFDTWYQMGFESISSTHPSDQTLRDHATATWTAGSEGPPGPQSMSTLPHLTIGEVHDASDLMVRSELGRGGMGVVHLARQHSLERDVAIKRVHDDGKPHVVTALIREARMMSLVEHPNVIPVHAMGLDDHGRPAVVMKRVEGTAWRNLIRDPDHAGWSALMDQGRDRLDDHIRVLLDVCNAVHFAHSRGLLHRDLKPENVMLGCFGEVYVLDWGLAIPIEEGRAQTRHLVGTPAYMAPEMLEVGQTIDVRTDVYLLGACLHEAVTGQPRHTGSTLQEVVRAARASEAHDYPPHIPQELATLCNLACAKDPGERPDSVEAFRSLLVAFQRHRVALRLTERAEEHARRWHSATGFEAETLFSRARHGFRDALDEWPQNTRALQALQGLLKAGVVKQIAGGNLDGAEASLRELQALDTSDLDVLRLDLQMARDEHEALGRLRIDQDMEISLRTRVLVALAFAASALVIGLLILRWQALGTWSLTYPNMMAMVLLADAVMLGILWVTRDALGRNEVNRNIRSIVLIAGFAPLTNRSLGWLADASPTHVLAVDLLFFACCAAIGSVILKARWLWVGATGFLLSAFLIALRPASAEWVFTFVPLIAVSLAAGGWLWQRRSQAR